MRVVSIVIIASMLVPTHQQQFNVVLQIQNVPTYLNASLLQALLSGVDPVQTLVDGQAYVMQVGPCPPGGYCPPGQGVSIPCPVSTYQPLQSQKSLSSCLSCPSTTYGPVVGMVSCLACPAGSFCVGGTSSATLCFAGGYCPASASATSPCLAGTYTPGPGFSACLPCPAGSFCLNVTSAPTQCAAGTYSPSQGRSACVTCSAGGYCLNASSAPISCPNGTFRASTGGNASSSCTAAPIGQYSGGSFSTASVLCSAGTYSSAIGQSACVGCALGTFYNSTGRTSQCPLCQAGSYCLSPVQMTACPNNTNSTPGASSILGCSCLGGYVCGYYKTVSVTFMVSNVTISDFNNNINNVQTNFIASVASAAGVSTSSVTIVSVTAMRRRRLLSDEDIIELSIVARIDPPSNVHLAGLEKHEHYVDHAIEKT